jgi:hypothetical protein
MQDTATFYKEVQKLLKAAGYKYKRIVQSAEEELRWEKPGKPNISLAGWHGTGNWGTVKVSFELYVGYESALVLSGIDDFTLVGNAYTMKPEFVNQYRANLDRAKKVIQHQING